jgi:DNA topoisomerase IB
LDPEAEEVAGFFAALLETEHAADTTFQANFFRDWQKLLTEHPPAENIKITDFAKCDFRPMYEYFEIQKEKKKQMTAAEKKQIKAEKDVIEKPYLFATIDGRKEKVGNFRVEPPGLFRGRGEHPKKGTHKYRLRPEDIVVNIAQDAPVPIPNIPGEWKEIVHDNTVTWLAHWKENVNGNSKYVFLSAGSTWKGQSDRQKFEKAKKLQVSYSCVGNPRHAYFVTVAAIRRCHQEGLHGRLEEQSHGRSTACHRHVSDRSIGAPSWKREGRGRGRHRWLLLASTGACHPDTTIDNRIAIFG